MKEFDAIVIGSGSGMATVEELVGHDMKVALVDRGPLGGTCPNLACIPSKVLIYAADRIVEIREAEKLGIRGRVESIDFASIMKRMHEGVQERNDNMRRSLEESENPLLFKDEGRFVRDYVLEVKGEEITSKNIFIGCGSRPSVPDIPGLDSVEYLNSEGVLQLEEQPESMIIIGGGYVGVEYAHFFSAIGTQVTLLEMTDRLVAGEEPEISDLLQSSLEKRMHVLMEAQVTDVREDSDGHVVVGVERKGKDDRKLELRAHKLMLAVGRTSNADVLEVEKTGVKVNKHGFIEVNEYLETSKKGIYAVGDVNGTQMFTHVGEKEAQVAANNLLHKKKVKMDYNVCPHAVFSHPQIASVGMTEEQARKQGHKLLVARPEYYITAKGEAMVEKEAFAKVIVDKDNLEILGFHIIGPYAPILIQEVVNAMTSGGHVDELTEGIHIHPAMAELIPVAFTHLEEA